MKAVLPLGTLPQGDGTAFSDGEDNGAGLLSVGELAGLARAIASSRCCGVTRPPCGLPDKRGGFWSRGREVPRPREGGSELGSNAAWRTATGAMLPP
mmetsp:Transcript_58122/g.91984  ORF Transcript_58122/g.91984 Transcript_58122/m.91984 type:complete len:97 (-) Transcript_58122:434-724(-)